MGCRLLLLIAAFYVTAVSVKAATKKSKTQYDTSKYASICKGKPPVSSRRQHAILQELLQTSGMRSLELSDTAQHKAACWILHEDKVKNKSGSKRLAQRYALATLWFGTQGSTKWEEKRDWLSRKHECKWYGVICNFKGTVVGLDLGFNKVDGLVPRELSLLRNLVELDVHGNDLQGVIPYKCLEGWTKLKILRLHMNGFFGHLPSEIKNLKNLQELHVFGNYFSGSIPTQLAELSRLEKLDLYANNFEGRIPSALGKLRRLREMDVHDNDLTGRMPDEICQLRMDVLQADCLGRTPEVRCDCCTICCAGLPHMKCVDMKTKEEIKLDMQKKK